MGGGVQAVQEEGMCNLWCIRALSRAPGAASLHAKVLCPLHAKPVYAMVQRTERSRHCTQCA